MTSPANFSREQREHGEHPLSMRVSGVPLPTTREGTGGNISAKLFPLFPLFSTPREQRKAFIHAVVPRVPPVPRQKETPEVRSARVTA